MATWISKYRKALTAGVLLTLVPFVYAGVCWQLRVSKAIDDTVPRAVELINEHDRQIVRLETENDGFRSDIASIQQDYERIQDLEVMVRALYIHITGDEPPGRGD